MRPETIGLLVDVRDAAHYIASETGRMTFPEFMEDRRVRHAVLYNFIVIGEAANRLRRRDPDVARRISNIQRIVGMRNVLNSPV
jgi:uncharacterized protein with HEPN domain